MSLSQQALSDALTAIAQAGGVTRDVIGLEEVLLATRNRIRTNGDAPTIALQRAGMARCLMPIGAWVAAEPSLQGLSSEVRSDVIWNLYIAAVSRTQAADAFPQLTGDLSVWSEVVAGLPITFAPTEAAQTTNVSALHWKCVAIGLMLLAADSCVPSGRTRVYVSLLRAVMLGLGSLLWYTGFTWFRSGMNTRSPGRQPSLGPSGATPWTSDNELPALEPIEPRSETTAVDTRMAFDTPPPGAPPLPMSQGIAGASVNSVQQTSMTAGLKRVQVLNKAPYQLLAGQQGQVKNVSGGLLTIELDNGMTLQSVPHEAVTDASTVGTQTGSASGESYAPYSLSGPGTKLQAQVARIKEAVVKAAALQRSTPGWGALFWQAVKNEKDIYHLEPEIVNLLQSHGYVGDDTKGPPRADELKKTLQELESVGGPPHGTGGSFARVAGIAEGANPEDMAWHLKLPADLQRAAPELYRNIRAEGCSSVRQWVNDQHPTLELKQSPGYQDLFMAATIIDFELAGCRSEAAVMAKLGTSDTWRST